MEHIMKTVSTTIAIVCSTILFSLACSDKNPADADIKDTPTTQPNDSVPSFVGDWKFSINPVNGITTDVINLNLAVAADTSYTLELQEESGKMLFSHYGTWEATDDSIFLKGTECMILDTATDPDSLKPLDDTACAAPIPLALPLEPDSWKIQSKSLSIVMNAFPIADNLKASIFIIFKEFDLDRQPE